MEIFLWIILGSLAGSIVAAGIKDGGKTIHVSDIILGSIGAVVGGLFTKYVAGNDVVGLYDETIVFAVFGAGVLIWLGRKFAHQLHVE